MIDLESDLREAFESRGFDVASVSVNRRQVRVVLPDEDAGPAEVQRIVRETVDDADVSGLTVGTEAIDGGERLATVVSFRRRA